jgi:hypothetical protein
MDDFMKILEDSERDTIEARSVNDPLSTWKKHVSFHDVFTVTSSSSQQTDMVDASDIIQ